MAHPPLFPSGKRPRPLPGTNILLIPLHLTSLAIILTVLTTTLFPSALPRIPICGLARTSSSSPSPEPTQTILFDHDSALEDFSPGGDPAWKRLTPQEGGSIFVGFNESFAVPWGISMFHGLHCLQSIRAALQMGPLGMGSGDRRDGGGGHAAHLDGVHLGHCLRYLAQNLQCAGDSTIEPPFVERTAAGDIALAAVDGVGVRHTCKDTSRMWSVSSRTETEWVDDWGWGKWREGDTVEGVFGWQ